MDLIGRRFGKLTVIANSNRRGFVICKCDCGNSHEVYIYNLTSYKTKSCGCYRKEVASAIGKRTIQRNSAEVVTVNKKYGTNVGVILKQTPYHNNKCGCKGISYDLVRNVYRADISLHKKQYYLGCYKHLEEAIRARQEAEERLFAPIIERVQVEQA